MKRTILAATVALVLAMPAAAQGASDSTAELQALRAQLQLLMQRVEQLEQAASSARQAADAGLVATPAIVPLTVSNELDWARRIKWKGDLRYRHEQFDVEGASSDRVRHRIRARFGLEAKLSDSLTAGLRLVTGSASDPRSTNATLDDAASRKEIALDQAYVTWEGLGGVAVTFGKQPQPWYSPASSMFFDSDVNPEGVALQYSNGAGLFTNAWGFWLEESAGGADGNLLGAQLGYTLADSGLTLAAGYWDYGAIQRQPMLNFSGVPAGNSIYLAGPSCLGAGATPCYLHDYNIAVLDAEWKGKLGALPVTLFGGYLHNMDPADLNSGYNLGFMLGKASSLDSWEFGLLYQQVERDAQFGLLTDSDFADGLTQGRGWQLQGAWVPMQNLTLKAALYLNERNFNTPVETDFKRLQLDLNFKF